MRKISDKDQEIYNLACDRGRAPLQGLKQALKNGNVKANAIICRKSCAYPVIACTVACGQLEHTKLLVKWGADLDISWEHPGDRSGLKQNLVTQCLRTHKRDEPRAKSEMVKYLVTQGCNWSSPSQVNPLHVGIQDKNNDLAMEYLLNEPQAKKLDQDITTKSYLVEAAIRHGNYKLALIAIQKGFKLDGKIEQLWRSLAQDFLKNQGKIEEISVMLVKRGGKRMLPIADGQIKEIESKSNNNAWMELRRWRAQLHKLQA